MYDWTTHAVNLAKEVLDESDRTNQSQCDMGRDESQIHTSTTCDHPDLINIRKIYRKEIENIIKSFIYFKLTKKEIWVKNVMTYVSEHVERNRNSI